MARKTPRSTSDRKPKAAATSDDVVKQTHDPHPADPLFEKIRKQPTEKVQNPNAGGRTMPVRDEPAENPER